MELECSFVKAENLATFVNPVLTYLVICNIAVNIQTLIYFSFMLSHKRYKKNEFPFHWVIDFVLCIFFFCSITALVGALTIIWKLKAINPSENKSLSLSLSFVAHFHFKA